MPVADLAAPDSALFLWATFPQLPEALRLIEAWGFTYKSVAFVWLKKNKKADSWFYGLGFWTRGNAEICLLATKGHPKRQAANIHQFIVSPIEAHSKKLHAGQIAHQGNNFVAGLVRLFAVGLNRGNAEICLLATKGHPKRQAANIHQFIVSPIEAHSKKPDEARAKIISLMGDLPRVELFARQTPPGWAVWGNEVTPTIPDFGTHCPEVQKGV